jgi:superfamily I DNA/RNA helicase
LALAVHCAQSLLQGAGESRDEDEIPLVQPASAGRRGALPVLMVAKTEREEADLIAERIVRAHADGMPLQDMAVLCRTKYLMKPIEQALARRKIAVQSMGSDAFHRFDWRRPSVKLVTLHSAKGLEFPLVFVAGLQAMPHKNEALDDEARLLYVAMTRATHELVLSAHGNSPIVARVKASLGEVGQRFAQGGR